MLQAALQAVGARLLRIAGSGAAPAAAPEEARKRPRRMAASDSAAGARQGEARAKENHTPAAAKRPGEAQGMMTQSTRKRAKGAMSAAHGPPARPGEPAAAEEPEAAVPRVLEARFGEEVRRQRRVALPRARAGDPGVSGSGSVNPNLAGQLPLA
jgi:hypothetical protein